MEIPLPATLLAALLLFADLADAQEQPLPLPLRLVERRPEAVPARPAASAPAAAPALAWPTNFAAAAAIAKQRQLLQLVMFTAKW